MIKKLNLNEIMHVAAGGPEHWVIKYIGEDPVIAGWNYAIVDTSTGKWISGAGAEYEPGTLAICRPKVWLERDTERRKKYVQRNGYPEPDPYLTVDSSWIPPVGYHGIKFNTMEHIKA